MVSSRDIVGRRMLEVIHFIGFCDFQLIRILLKAFINIESAGSNGKEILFQSGPNHSWLVEVGNWNFLFFVEFEWWCFVSDVQKIGSTSIRQQCRRRSLPIGIHSVGHRFSCVQRLWKHSRYHEEKNFLYVTDWRNFFGVTGLDLAHPMNGYRYHTKYDHINYISTPCLQRTGDNVLGLVRSIANSEQLNDIKVW